ncbi:hypothetical protein DFH06DRAFT_1252931 [Mycena polygramma]|nr:hypothetical protein DFH06DRAFT_1252931 [Mycena polygramma]
MPDNDQASSAKTNFNSVCTLHSAVDCVGTASLTIQPETTVNNFSVNNFDNVMSSYRCSFKYPGFTWCYDTNLQGKCVAAATEDGVCVNINSATVNMPDNDQASSAMANPRSKCTLYAAVNCLQKELVLQPGSRNDDFSIDGFNNVMSSYKCSFVTV